MNWLLIDQIRLIRSKSATKTDNDWSRHRARHSKWVCYNDKSIVDLLIESIIKQKTSSIKCNRHERNKFCKCKRCRHESKDNDWSHWLSSSLDSESAWKTWIDSESASMTWKEQALLCSRHESEVSLLQWHLTRRNCYEHVWINQSSDLTLINLIKASHDAMSSLNLAHLFESFSALLLVVQHFLHSFLSSFF